MKAISNVIASLLMLIITIALAGLAYAYITGVFTSRISYTFSLLGGEMIAGYPVITLSNDGTNTITTINSITIDGKPVNFSVIPENDNTLVAYYPLDEGSGTVAKDFSGNGNDGNLVNGPTWVDGKYGKALSFDGVDDYVEVPDSLSLNPKSITIEFWVYQISRNPNTWTFLVNKDGWKSYHLISEDVWATNRVGFTVRVNGADYRLWTSKAIGSYWSYLAFTYDASTGEQRTYVNGELDTEVLQPVGDIDTLAGPLRITGSKAERFHGLIDEVRIYNRALTEEEIKSVYQIGNPIPAGTIARIRLYPSTALSTGTHTVRVCVPGMCQKTYLYIR